MACATTSSSSYPEGSSIQSLMDAVAQVTNQPARRCNKSQPTAPNAIAHAGTGTSGTTIAPFAIQMQRAPIGGGMPFAARGDPPRKRKHGPAFASGSIAAVTMEAPVVPNTKEDSDNKDNKRSKRLEQNRLAAVESRRRKKHMVEELQRSVHYYSKVNTSLKSQNADLERQLLVAKQGALAKSNGTRGDSSSADSALVNAGGVRDAPAKVPPCSPQKSTPEAKISDARRPRAALDGSTSSSVARVAADVKRQAQQAQFAATQALYKSMGYSAGAARAAANTFSRFVGQTGSVPALSPARRDGAHSLRAAAASAVGREVPTSPEIIEAEDEAYVRALNRFVMQQAATANAAAAAATAAIQAANLHGQLKNNGDSTSSTIQALSAFSFPFPAGVPWPVQNQVPSVKNE